jgi:DNA (cytosine-5)-methyltransferase 1
MAIPVIDLFAGPGGLGEGFSSVTDDKGERIFKIKLSIEKDEDSLQTLRLRSFFRQFKKGRVPNLYYAYVKENSKKKQLEILDAIKTEYTKAWENADKEVWLCELGNEKFPPAFVDYRIRKALNKQKDWILIGGPPCQAYSLVGRSRNKGLHEEDHRVFLYREYLRIIAKHHPKVFVMENVKGLLSAKLDGSKIFDWIKADLKNPGRVFPGKNSPKYKIYSFAHSPEKFDKAGNPIYKNDIDFLIRMEDYGIPQKRHRVILLGIREDLEGIEISPLKQKPKINLRQVIGSLPALRSGVGREVTGTNEKGNHIYSSISNTQQNWEKAVKDSINRLKREFPNLDFNEIGRFPDSQGSNFIDFILNEENNPLFNEWYKDDRIGGVLNHETRTHLKEDLCRYLFSSLYLKEKGDFPKLRDYPEWLLPKHKNAKGGKFADRFRTQQPEQPATTVTSHISKDGHYFIHYDTVQCRSLTVREAARIQTFPDNYYFCGTRTQQYHQVGNAVPPHLAKQLAVIVLKFFVN